MPPASADSAREVTYAIEFHRFSGTVQNPDFKGPGLLTIRPEGLNYIFSGQPRGFLAPKSARLVFGPDDIANVTLDGQAILFTTHRGQAGKRRQPFGFYCRDEAEAATVAALLPRNLDREFTESRAFGEKLNAVAGAASPWTSVTNIIIALNAVVFVIMGCLGAGWFETETLLPYVLYGANNGAATTDGEWWRLLTSMFMHYGLLHLLFNMWALFQAGHFLEKLQGRALYTLTYLGSGLAGGFASMAWHGDQTWSAGASGAVFGVYAAILGYLLREKQALPPGVYKAMMKSSLTFAGYNILYGMARAGIDNAAHLGGVAGGLVLGWLLALPLDREIRARQTGRRLQLGLLVLAVLVALGVGLTPRYDYRVADVVAWQQANRPFRATETKLIEENEQSLRRLAGNKVDPQYPDWVEAQLIPFYEKWSQALSALSLAPDKSTARLQAETLSIFKMRLESYRHLVAGLRARDRDAAPRFFEEDAKVSAAIVKLQKAYER